MKLSLLLLLAVLVVIILAAAYLANRLKRVRAESGGGALDGIEYERAAFFSPAERSFLGVLDQAVGSQYRVFGKVRVADVLAVGRRSDADKRKSAFNRISAKHFDFLVCAPDDVQVLCAIELNDGSHTQTRRRERDDFLAEACKQAQLPLLMLPAKHAYSVDEIRRLVLAALGVPLPTPQAPHPVKRPEQEATAEAVQSSRSPQIVPESESVAREALQTGEQLEPEHVAAPACPKCGDPMVKRTGKSGSLAGKTFWGCNRYPACRGMLST